MFSQSRLCFHFFCVLNGFLAFSQQAGGNANARGASTGKTYFFYQLPTYPRDCKEVLDQCSHRNSSGVFLIKPDGYPHPFEVYCNNSFESGGWTVLMRRLDGSLVFSRNWDEYKKGFGFLSGEFWFGNDKLAILTNQQTYALRVDVTISNGSQASVTYSNFRVSDEWGNYALASLGNATGKIGFLITGPTCPANMIHTNCTCERTCEAPTICQNNCQEASRCVCPEGFFLRGTDCVTPEQCECYFVTADKVIPMGESHINNQCSTQCSCYGNGLECSNYSCDPNARCIGTSQGGQCPCNTGLIGDGRDCRCPANMIYRNCTCERTCEAPTICQNNCQEASRCVCPDGFFLRGSDCVSPEECQCYSATADKVIPVGESYINSQCSELCSCSGSGLSCSNYNCDPNARCTITNKGGQCTCNKGFTGDGLDCGCEQTGYLVDGSVCRRPRDCDEVPSVNGYTGSGLYYILPSNWQEFQAYCNMSEGRWTVFQRRIPGSGRNFQLSWSSYKRGFGQLDEDFWLGNDRIHYLTSQRNYQLRIDIIDSGNRHYRAQYNGFRIGNEGSKYRMTVLGSYSGNAGNDAMRYHRNQPFSTHDQDNDNNYYYYSCSSYGHCARLHEGGWWYRYRSYTFSHSCDRYHHSYCNYSYSCAYTNLNGKESGSSGETIFWHGLSGNDCGIKYTEMKIRPL
ncbi:Fibrinogen-like protein A [Holothuria leucospilota]|uniref:Fibrinogen-like protein A n=1 Tax=Holothuria leucospilota TaxID=206669 RepID=A0A9Q1H657_HOLLE|nr:Fibrinogen-like protein A [Holothuria leucospilota]